MSRLNEQLGLTTEDAQKIKKRLLTFFPSRIITLEEIKGAFNEVRDFNHVRLEHYFSRLRNDHKGYSGRLLLPNNKTINFSYMKKESYEGQHQKYFVYLL